MVAGVSEEAAQMGWDEMAAMSETPVDLAYLTTTPVFSARR